MKEQTLIVITIRQGLIVKIERLNSNFTVIAGSDGSNRQNNDDKTNYVRHPFQQNKVTENE